MNIHMTASEASCFLCDAQVPSDVNSMAFALPDKFPVTEGHTLVCPRRHVSSIFDLNTLEWNGCFELLLKIRARIMNEDVTVTGFNIGVNDGTDAGQTVPHCHIHLIPRRKGDVQNPVGGVRNVIPDKGVYLGSPVQGPS